MLMCECTKCGGDNEWMVCENDRMMMQANHQKSKMVLQSLWLWAVILFILGIALGTS